LISRGRQLNEGSVTCHGRAREMAGDRRATVRLLSLGAGMTPERRHARPRSMMRQAEACPQAGQGSCKVMNVLLGPLTCLLVMPR
jgi:hypothetical protein